MCIHPNMVLDEFKGILDLTPFWVKNLEKIAILSLWTQLLLEFLLDIYLPNLVICICLNSRVNI